MLLLFPCRKSGKAAFSSFCKGLRAAIRPHLPDVYKRQVFGEWADIAPVLESNKDSIIQYEVENDRRNSAIPLLDLKNINARIEPGVTIRECCLLYTSTDLPGADDDGFTFLTAFVHHGGVWPLHPQRAASAPDEMCIRDRGAGRRRSERQYSVHDRRLHRPLGGPGGRRAQISGHLAGRRAGEAAVSYTHLPMAAIRILFSFAFRKFAEKAGSRPSRTALPSGPRGPPLFVFLISPSFLWPKPSDRH